MVNRASEGWFKVEVKGTHVLHHNARHRGITAG